jgi:hypothetical protein
MPGRFDRGIYPYRGNNYDNMLVWIDSSPVRQVGCCRHIDGVATCSAVAHLAKGAAVVEPIKLEPTMEEIVVALRETRRGAGRVPPFTVVGGNPANDWAPGVMRRGGAGTVGAQSGSGSTDISDLRDGEIERLLTENARLNERVVFLLKVIEREQARNAEFAAERVSIETDRDAFGRDVKTALEAQLRPVLLVLLRLLEKQRALPASAGARIVESEETCRAAPVVAPERIVDTGCNLDSEAETPALNEAVATSAGPSVQPEQRQQMARSSDVRGF